MQRIKQDPQLVDLFVKHLPTLVLREENDFIIEMIEAIPKDRFTQTTKVIDAVRSSGTFYYDPNQSRSNIYNRLLLQLLLSNQADKALYLLQTSDKINFRDENAHLLLQTALNHYQEQIALLLIEKGAPVDIVYKKGITPFSIACQNGMKKAAILMIQKGIQVELLIEDVPGNLFSFLKKHLELFRYLFEKNQLTYEVIHELVNEKGLEFLKTILPAWDWTIFEKPIDLITIKAKILSDPSILVSPIFQKQRSNPLLFCLLFKEKAFYDKIVSILSPHQKWIYVSDFLQKYMDLFLFYHANVPEPIAMSNLPKTGAIPIPDAYSISKAYQDLDRYLTEYIEKIPDHFLQYMGKKITRAELKQGCMKWNKTLLDPKNSPWKEERDQKEFQEVHEKFRAAIFGLNQLIKKLKEEDLEEKEKIELEMKVCYLLSFLSASANHTLTIKNEMLEEAVSILFTKYGLLSFTDRVDRCLLHHRMTILEGLYPNLPILIKEEGERVGIPKEVLISSMDIVESITPHLKEALEGTIRRFFAVYTPYMIYHAIIDLAAKECLVTKRYIKEWFFENRPAKWDPWQEIKRDLYFLSDDEAVEYLKKMKFLPLMTQDSTKSPLEQIEALEKSFPFEKIENELKENSEEGFEILKKYRIPIVEKLGKNADGSLKEHLNYLYSELSTIEPLKPERILYILTRLEHVKIT